MRLLNICIFFLQRRVQKDSFQCGILVSRCIFFASGLSQEKYHKPLEIL